MEKLTKIEKLNNSNYFMWKYKIELYLINQDLWNVLSEEAPSTPARLREWIKKDNKARTTIGLLVEDNQLVHIRGKTTALETWNALKSIHEKNTLTNRISIYKKIALTKMNESDDMEDHLNRLIDLFQKLEDLGDIASEQWKIGIVFASLSQSYSTLITALEARPEEDLTWSIVYTKILDEFQRQKEQEGNYFKKNEEKVMKVSMSKEVTFCYFCKKNTHKMHDCYKLKRYHQFQEFEKFQKDAEEKKINKANQIEIKKDEDDEFMLCIVADDAVTTNSIQNSEKSKDSNLLIQVNILRELRNFEISLKGNIVKDVNFLSHLFNKMKSVGNEVTDIQKIAFTLNTLPIELNKFIVQINTRKIHNWNNFKEILFEEWKINQNQIQEEKKGRETGKSEILNTKWKEFKNGSTTTQNQMSQINESGHQKKKKKGTRKGRRNF